MAFTWGSPRDDAGPRFELSASCRFDRAAWGRRDLGMRVALSCGPGIFCGSTRSRVSIYTGPLPAARAHRADHAAGPGLCHQRSRRRRRGERNAFPMSYFGACRSPRARLPGLYHFAARRKVFRVA